MAPMLTFSLAMIAWAVIPVDDRWAIADINVGVLYLFAISSLGVYGIMIAGWASNSKYAFLGALRRRAQMVSYEVSMGFVIVSVLLCAGSLRLNDIVLAQRHVWYCIPLFPMFIMFFISILAETNRNPFDLPEGESEIVAGFFVEYSAMAFALFFLGEYANMILMSAMTTILFLGGWLAPIPLSAVHLAARADLVHPEDLHLPVRVHLGARDAAALPLRPADAARLEGVLCRCRSAWLVLTAARAAGDRMGCPMLALDRDSASHEQGLRWRPWTAPRAACCCRRWSPGIWLTLRYFFRPKATINYPYRRARSARASAASTRCAATRTARSAASPASCARRSARRRQSRSRPSRATTARGAPRATTST